MSNYLEMDGKLLWMEGDQIATHIFNFSLDKFICKQTWKDAKVTISPKKMWGWDREVEVWLTLTH